MRVTRQFVVTWASSLRLVASVMRSSPYRWCSLLFHLLTGPAKAGQPCVLSACQWSMPPAPSLGRVPGGLLGLHCIVPQYETSDASIIFFTPARSTVVIRLWLFVFCCSCLAWLQILLRCSFLLRSPLIHRTLHMLYAKSEGVGCSCFHPSLPVGLSFLPFLDSQKDNKCIAKYMSSQDLQHKISPSYKYYIYDRIGCSPSCLHLVEISM